MKMYGIVILGALALGACGKEETPGGDGVIIVDSGTPATDSGLMGRPDATPGARPDAGRPDTGPPAMECATAALPPAYEGETCNRDTRDCFAGVTSEEDFAACVEADDRPDDCNSCLNTSFSGCVTERNPGPWNCLNQCYAEKCASAGSQEEANACVEDMCGNELDDYRAAGMDMSAAQACFMDAVVTCTPDSATREEDPAPPAADAGTEPEPTPGGGGGSGLPVPFALPAFGAFSR